MRAKSLITIALLAALCGCGKNNTAPASGQTATLTLKDGTTVTGTVTKSDTSSITLESPNGVVSTYPMTQVSSVNYGSAPPAPAPTDTSAQNAPPPAPAPGQTAPPASYPPPQTYPPPAQPAQGYQPAATFRVIPAGATLAVRTNQTINGQTAQPGQTYSGEMVRDVVDKDGRVAIPRRSRVTLVVRDANRQGKVQGRSELAVDVGSVDIGGHPYRLETSNFVEKGKEGLGANKRTAEYTGGGGLFGTIIGAVAGGGKGAAIGALSGAAAGAATQSLTRGKPAVIPAEAVLNFRLEAPIRIREMQ